MKLRSRDEIQTSEHVPSYVHSSVVTYCNNSNSNTEDTVNLPDIIYNAKYEYSSTGETSLDKDKYSRDNYCIIPLIVPSMTLDNESATVEKPDDLMKLLPKPSTKFGYNYNYKILTDGSLLLDTAVVLSGVSVNSERIIDIFNLDKCSCDCTSSDYSDVCSTVDERLFGPIDSVFIPLKNISDEYAVNWPSTWDMDTVYPSGRGPKKPDDSSSSVPPVSTGAVFLCRIDVPPTGNGGTATVSVISVSGSGAVKPGQTLTVNVPSI